MGLLGVGIVVCDRVPTVNICNLSDELIVVEYSISELIVDLLDGIVVIGGKCV